MKTKKIVATAGYTGNILRVDLSSGLVTKNPTSQYASRFLGGRGIAAKIYWDEVSPETHPFDPENRLIMITGPLCGIPGLAGSRWQVCGKSPMTEPEHFSYANLGGNWGVQLKFAGHDGLVIQGKSDKPVYLDIHDDTVQIKDAIFLWGKGAAETRHVLQEELGKKARVVAIGSAGENRVPFACLLADMDAAGSSGFGAVMGAKNLKAVVVRGTGSILPAQPDALGELTRIFRKNHTSIEAAKYPVPLGPNMKKDVCFGCIKGCLRMRYKASDGTSGKHTCQSSVYYLARAYRYYGEQNEVPYQATRLCDDYGLDSIVLESIILLLSRCQKAGILNDDNTGLPLSRIGSLEFIEQLIRKISLKEGFGEVLAKGPVQAAHIVGKGAPELIADYVVKAGQNCYYEGRVYTTSSLLYAMEPRQPIQQLHESASAVIVWARWIEHKEGYLSTSVLLNIARKFWGGESAVDFSTYEGKALAAKKIQDRQYAKESLILCDFAWPMMYIENSDDHVGDPTLESRVLSAVIGKEISEDELYLLGERVFNLQRAILVREGHYGRDSDHLPEPYYMVPLKKNYPLGLNPNALVPGKDGQVISKIGAVVDRDKFEQMKAEYYQLRGWDPVTGLQTREQLKRVGLDEVAGESVWARRRGS